MKAFTSASKKGVQPFNDSEEEVVRNLVWIGPYHVVCCVVEIYGPLQIVFAALALLAAAFVVIELWREEVDTFRLVVGVVFIAVCIYLTWLCKSIYLLRAFRKEIDNYDALNKQLKGQMGTLEAQNKAYDIRNREQERLIGQLNDRVSDLTEIEGLLDTLNHECKGNVDMARLTLQRLERNIKLDTLNSAFLFFNRVDRNRDGKLGGRDVVEFVDSLAFLWRYLPHVDPDRVKSSIKEQGSLTMDQVRVLVDGLMPELGSGG